MKPRGVSQLCQDNIASDNKASVISFRSHRSKLSPVDWERCIFCQDDKPSVKVHNIQVSDTSTAILNLAKQDSTLRSRLAEVHDLIVAEGKYHLICYSKFLKKHKNITDFCNTNNPIGVCLNHVVNELREGLARGKIFSLSAI